MQCRVTSTIFGGGGARAVSRDQAKLISENDCSNPLSGRNFFQLTLEFIIMYEAADRDSV